MTQKLRAPDAFAEGLTSVPSVMWQVTTVVVTTRKSRALSWPLWHKANTVHRHARRQNTYLHRKYLPGYVV